jgi:hypothetical protein
MIYYSISSTCTDPSGNTLFLTAIRATQTVEAVTSLGPNDPSQLWTPVMDGSSDNAFVLLNQETNMVIVAGANGPVSLAQSNTTSRATWLFINTGAIQLQADTGQNLNVSGDGPYNSGTAILTFGWDGGASNETWKMNKIII